jgi:hypothetical protein
MENAELQRRMKQPDVAALADVLSLVYFEDRQSRGFATWWLAIEPGIRPVTGVQSADPTEAERVHRDTMTVLGAMVETRVQRLN